MKKIWGWVAGIVVAVALIFYFIWNGSNSAPVAALTTTGGGNPAPDTIGQGSGATTTTTGSGSSGGVTTTGAYKDGTYTGNVADAVYGQLQVAVTISGGRITNVTFPVYPNSPGHTSEVAAFALPQLKQEAIASQSANVNIVSGATQDSQAFQESLASALAQAKS